MSVRPIPAWRRRLAAERRLIALGAASLLLHLLALGIIARGKPRPPPAPTASLTVQLRGAAATAPAGAAAPTAAAVTAAPPPLRPRTAAPSINASPGKRVAPPNQTAPTDQAAPAAPPSGIPSWDVMVAAGPAEAPAAAARPRGMQAVQTPPPARLAYAVTVAAPAARERGAGTASLEWRTGGEAYRLLLDGSNGVMGVLETRGQLVDGGFIPLEVRGADGADAVGFDWSLGRATFSRSGRVAGIGGDGQDRASMLMRLTGIALADAGQLDGGIELPVAGADGVATVAFDNLGSETLNTALGPIAAVHLRQRAAAAVAVTVAAPGKPAGAPLLDIWLAPAHDWYPVQLRLTAADGSVVTQTVTAIGAAGADGTPAP